MSATTVPALPMNGAEGDAEYWTSIDWNREEAFVKQLRQRIYRAARIGDQKQVRNLQKLMLRSRANTLTSVRRVTQRSAGKKTPGIDGVVALTSESRGNLARQMLAEPATPAKPVKRVYIPKANGKTRPLGIPVIQDRVNQARAKNALEPEWEARFERRSYGFRPGRGCHDAIAAIFHVASKKTARRLWVLDADLSAAFDRIDHGHLLESIGLFPGRKDIQSWLRAGVMEQGTYAHVTEGTPQGGVISPLLLNIALHGMGEAIGGNLPAGSDRNSPSLIRYADDFVVLCFTEEEVYERKAELASWLSRGGWPSMRRRLVSSTSAKDLTSSGSMSGATTARCSSSRARTQCNASRGRSRLPFGSIADGQRRSWQVPSAPLYGAGRPTIDTLSRKKPSLCSTTSCTGPCGGGRNTAIPASPTGVSGNSTGVGSRSPAMPSGYLARRLDIYRNLRGRRSSDT